MSFRTYWTLLSGLTFQLRLVSAYPKASVNTTLSLDTRAEKFGLAGIGDSWAAGVAYNKEMEFDGECLRNKYAWAPMVNASYADWMPEGKEPDFEFKACSGARLEHMQGQMDQTTRPKVVIMEAGGNNADFYPLADACLFHQQMDHAYGTLYSDDSWDNPTGDCKREILMVRERVEGNFIKDKVVDTINMWKGHRAVWGNDASLYLIGYGKFFAYNKECDDWNFEILTAKDFNGTQNVVLDMRKDINALTDHANRAIREAAESFNDPKIQYIDIDPAFNGHRFCEEGHSYKDQWNWHWPGKDSKVWFWNNPTRSGIGNWTIKKGGEVKTYQLPATYPPEEDLYLLNHKVQEETGDGGITLFRDPQKPEITLEIHMEPMGDDVGLFGSNSPNAMIARTLHPVNSGHKAMSEIIVNRLKQDFRDRDTSSPPTNTQPSTPPEPSKAVSIVLDEEIFSSEFSWIFYGPPVGTSAVCGGEEGAPGIIPFELAFNQGSQDEWDINHPPWPGGIFALTDVYGEDCEFKCDGTNAGALFCGDREVKCKADPAKYSGKDGTHACPGTPYIHHAAVLCEW